MDPTMLPLFATPGTLELAVILLIAVLLFGANKIPKLARSTGQAMGEFQRGREEIEQELEDMKDTASDAAPSTGLESESGGGTESTPSQQSSSAEAESTSSDSDQTDETENN